jgi:GTP-binding protein
VSPVDGDRSGGDDAATGDIDRERNERARHLFAQACTFVAGATSIDQLPPPGQPEVAFAGRSNVGKSSLLNALTGRRTLARTSATPGRTRQINFFSLGERLVLVDLPGYGYAKAPKALVQAWSSLIDDFLAGRPTLRRILLLVDGRHGLKAADREAIDRFDSCATAFQVVLTKCDKVPAAELARRVRDVAIELQRHPAAHPRIIETSAADGTGIDDLRVELAAFAGPP